MLPSKVAEKLKKHHTVCSENVFLIENRAVYEMWKKYSGAGQATYDKFGASALQAGV